MSRKQIWYLAIFGGVLYFVVSYVAPTVLSMISPNTPTPAVITTVPASIGCTGSISFRIEEDGTITTWCAGG